MKSKELMTELRSLDRVQLEERLLTVSKRALHNRVAKAVGQLGQSHFIKQDSSEIARIKTVITEKAKQVKSADARGGASG